MLLILLLLVLVLSSVMVFTKHTQSLVLDKLSVSRLVTLAPMELQLDLALVKDIIMVTLVGLNGHALLLVQRIHVTPQMD